MGRMLKALQQLEVNSPPPQQPSGSPPPQAPASRRAAPPEGAPPDWSSGDPRVPTAVESAVDAALARAESAAAAVCEEHEQAASDSPVPSWPIRTSLPHAPAYRDLAENILSQIPPGHAAALLFTSPADGEGTTVLLVSLAAALAERISQGVLLLDGNLQKPDLARRLGLETTGGLSPALAGATGWRQALRKTSIPHLELLTGSDLPPPGVGPSAPWGFRSLLGELRGHYRLILVDGASLVHPEVAPMATDCDGTYLVVRLKRHTRRHLATAVRVIQDCRARLLGSVVIGS
jgi:Mrp family chromosome partitioning ATPase